MIRTFHSEVILIIISPIFQTQLVLQTTALCFYQTALMEPGSSTVITQDGVEQVKEETVAGKLRLVGGQCVCVCVASTYRRSPSENSYQQIKQHLGPDTPALISKAYQAFPC